MCTFLVGFCSHFTGLCSFLNTTQGRRVLLKRVLSVLLPRPRFPRLRAPCPLCCCSLARIRRRSLGKAARRGRGSDRALHVGVYAPSGSLEMDVS